MNVSCTSCSAKYGIPDEKVRGKKVKITCKHCGTAIVVDGTTLDTPAAAAAPAAAPAPAAQAVAPAPAAKAAAAPLTSSASPKVEASSPAAELTFDIAYPDDRQETLKLSEIVAKYAKGELGDDAFLWREGMSDWKAPRDVPEVASALSARVPAAKPQNALTYEEDEATKIQVSPMDALGDDVAGEWREPAKEAPSHPQAPFDLRAPSAAAPAVTSPSAKAAGVAAKAEPAKPAAARRSAARGGGDLFGDLAAAGSEEDESLGIDAKEMAPKMTGARNESSVLFSLDSLVKQEQKQAAPKKASSKRDDAASILMGSDSGPSSLANVGTGSFGSAFAAPDFNAPVTVVPEVRAQDPFDASGAPAKKGGAGIWIGLLAVLVIGGGAAAMFFSGKLGGTPPAPAPTVAATTSKPETPPAPSAEPSAAEVASAAPAQSGAAHVASNTGGNAAATTATAGSTSPTTAATTAKPGEAATKPGEVATKPAERPAETPASKPPAAPVGDSSAPPFDTNAAKTALGAAAGNAGSCKTADGPTGNGKVSVTFMPSGRATNTQVSGDLAGTAVGGCVARLFRSAKVPAFSGDPVTVSKSFAIQ